MYAFRGAICKVLISWYVCVFAGHQLHLTRKCVNQKGATVSQISVVLFFVHPDLVVFSINAQVH